MLYKIEVLIKLNLQLIIYFNSICINICRSKEGVTHKIFNDSHKFFVYLYTHAYNDLFDV